MTQLRSIASTAYWIEILFMLVNLHLISDSLLQNSFNYTLRRKRSLVLVYKVQKTVIQNCLACIYNKTHLTWEIQSQTCWIRHLSYIHFHIITIFFKFGICSHFTFFIYFEAGCSKSTPVAISIVAAVRFCKHIYKHSLS